MMHDHDHDEDLKYMCMEKMEHMFLRSPHGQQFAAEYQQIEHEMKAIEQRQKAFWAKAKPAFKEYMYAM